MNKLAPFSRKQIDYFNKVYTSWFNVAEGGKRGGKNVLQTLAFCEELEIHPDKLHLVAGVSTATAKLNILDCDGFGLYNYFAGRFRKGKYENRECVYIKTKTGEKVVLISGGGKSGDEKLIKGNTYGMAYVTEANECTKMFIQEVMDRTTSSKRRKVFHDLNPKTPTHWYYTDVLDYHTRKQQENTKYGYNYGMFNIADNLSISDAQLKQIISTYDKNSIWYKRDIRGERCNAEGLVYRQFADNVDKYLIEIKNNEIVIDGKPKALLKVIVGVDFGGNGSKHSFVCCGITANYEHLVVLENERINATDTDVVYLSKKYVDFIKMCYDKYSKAITSNCDSAEQVLIVSLRNASIQNRLVNNVVNAKKIQIVDRIRALTLLIGSNKFKVANHCRYVINALSTAQWDEKHPDERLDDGTTDIDTMDALEYCFEKEIKNFNINTFIRR